MIRAVIFMAALAGAAPALAHPHAATDRQTALTLGPEGATVVLSVAPGTEDGPRIAALLDADADGAVTDAEAGVAAMEILAGTSLRADGASVPLALVSAEAGPADWLAQGMGALRVEIRASFDMAAAREVTLALEHAAFGAGWFVQPYYAGGLWDGRDPPAIERGESGVVLRLTD